MIICDVDGTVCESCQVIKPKVAKLLKNCGQEIVFLSGTDAKELYRMLPGFEDHYILSNSGAECWYKNEKLYAESNLADAKNIIVYLKSFHYENADMLDRGNQITWSLAGRFSPLDIKKAFDPDGVIRSKLVKLIKKQFPNLSVRLGGTSSIDIGGINKLEGLKKFLKHRNVKLEDVIYVGDGFDGNDKPLLNYVPCVHVKNPEQFEHYLRALY